MKDHIESDIGLDQASYAAHDEAEAVSTAGERV